jgi:ligand-binding sensor domain-containing protein
MLGLKRILFFIGGWLLTLQAFTQAPPIGNWRLHHSYVGTVHLAVGDKIYAATKEAIFSVNNTGGFEYFNKLTGLSEASIATIQWESETAQLVVAYSNNNIDVIKGGLVKNIYDLVRTSNIKTINSIYCDKGMAYIATNIGVVVVNLLKYEIKESWILGPNGSPIEVFSISKDSNFWYAATSVGIYKSPLSNTNLADAKSWTIFYTAGMLPPIKKISSAPTGLIIEKNDSLLLIQPGSTTTLFYKASEQIKTWQFNEQKITIGTTNTQTKKAFLYHSAIDNPNLLVFEQAGILNHPSACMFSNGSIWIGDSTSGLFKLDPTTKTFTSIVPNGPAGQITTALEATSSSIIAASNTKAGLFILENGKWLNQKQNGLDSVAGVQSIATSNYDNSIWLTTAQKGVAKWHNNKVQIFDARNSSLKGATNFTCFTSGVAADTKGNTWISNAGTTIALHVYQPDGKWTGFTNPYALTDAGALEIDDLGQIWCATTNANGLLVYNPGSSLTTSADDKWKQYKAGSGIGNLPSNLVNCIVKDKNGFIWVGTDKGIGIIQCIENIFTPAGCDALLPVVQQDRFTGLLFKDENVQTIAVDGADRKWVGTKNGVWLISATGEKVIYRFSVGNSPLPGNDISKISIDPLTGEVFIATNNGLCSFRSTATEPVSSQQKLLVFPNPVPPGYNGSIAIRGLTNNALVKITNLYGALVYQTRALGGQAIWDGKNTNGTKVASGVYLIICRDDSGIEKIATKITIVQGR